MTYQDLYDLIFSPDGKSLVAVGEAGILLTGKLATPVSFNSGTIEFNPTRPLIAVRGLDAMHGFHAAIITYPGLALVKQLPGANFVWSPDGSALIYNNKAEGRIEALPVDDMLPAKITAQDQP